jgi:hypothetical protein
MTSVMIEEVWIISLNDYRFISFVSETLSLKFIS